MAEGKFVSYLRVSTAREGRSGLGLEAQRQAVEDFLNGGNWTLVKEFVEVESGKKADRPELAKAFQACRVYGAKLVIAKLDRLSRDAHFLLGLEKAGVDFVAADMPQANRMTVGIMAIMAEEERRRISERTKAALAAAKRRGVKLGGDRGARLTAKARAAGRAALQAKARARAADLSPTVKELQAGGAESLRAIAAGLDERGIPAARGGKWSAVQVSRLLEAASPFDASASAAVLQVSANVWGGHERKPETEAA
jgi:DNA invertase Pin-like site-specific DNA recombinase